MCQWCPDAVQGDAAALRQMCPATLRAAGSVHSGAARSWLPNLSASWRHCRIRGNFLELTYLPTKLRYIPNANAATQQANKLQLPIPQPETLNCYPYLKDKYLIACPLLTAASYHAQSPGSNVSIAHSSLAHLPP